MSLEEGHEDGQRSGAPVLEDRLRELVLLSLGKRRLPVPEGGLQGSWEGSFY